MTRIVAVSFDVLSKLLTLEQIDVITGLSHSSTSRRKQGRGNNTTIWRANTQSATDKTLQSQIDELVSTWPIATIIERLSVVADKVECVVNIGIVFDSYSFGLELPTKLLAQLAVDVELSFYPGQPATESGNNK